MTTIDVAVAVMFNARGEVLTSWRKPQQHQGGLWEFPGGKREPDESRFEALRRELSEELGVRVTQAEPFVRVDHDYGDKLVCLDVWLVSAYSGMPMGREGQPLRWQSVSDLAVAEFPAANAPIIDALKRLPD